MGIGVSNKSAKSAKSAGMNNVRRKVVILRENCKVELAKLTIFGKIVTIFMKMDEKFA